MKTKTGPSFKLSMIVVGIGALLAFIATFMFYDQIGNFLDPEVIDAPAAVERDLPEGELFLLTSSLFSAAGAPSTNTIDITNLSTGETIPVFSTSDDFEYQVGFEFYRAFGVADIPADGDYRINVGADAGQVAILPDPIGTALGLIVPGVLMAAGSLIVVIGFIMWLIGWNRRRNAPQGPGSTGLGPPPEGLPGTPHASPQVASPNASLPATPPPYVGGQAAPPPPPPPPNPGNPGGTDSPTPW